MTIVNKDGGNASKKDTSGQKKVWSVVLKDECVWPKYKTIAQTIASNFVTSKHVFLS